MAKLTGAKKAAFLKRMAKGRKKAARGNPKRKTAAKKKTAAKRKPAKKKPAGKLTGAKKAEFLRRMARGRKKATRGNPKRKTAAKKKTAKRTAPKRNTAPKRTKARRRNSEASAAAMFETFHQKPPARIIEYEELVNFPHHFAELGRLKELRINLDRANPKYPFTGFGDCQVVSTPDGANIYFVGGDQRVNLEALDIASDKDMIELAPCVYICYHTVKGFHDFAPIDYFHSFGEEDGIRPMLAYDRLNKNLFLLGGNYQVKREGIVN